MKNFLLLMLLSMSPIAFAGEHASPKLAPGQVPVVSFIEVDAEYVTVPLSISSNAKSPAERYRLIHNLQRLIMDKAKTNPDLSVEEVSPLQPLNGKPEQSMSSALGTLYISAQLGSASEPFEAAELVYEFIFGITIPSNTDVKYGELFLSISNPEQFRKSIEAKVRTEIGTTLQSLGSSYSVKIMGMNAPVAMLNRGGVKLAMFIPYKVTYEQK